MNFEGKRITDERRQTYELERKLGEGGQGAVYSAKGGKRAALLSLWCKIDQPIQLE